MPEHAEIRAVDGDYNGGYDVVIKGFGSVMVRIDIQLTEEQVRGIKKIAASRSVSMAKVIRDAVEGTIRSGSASEEKRKRALEVVGKFRSGKKDISKKHDDYLSETFK